jgi:galactokinase
VKVWAPGRVNLIGEHTDYSGGLVMPIAIELGITLEVLAVSTEVELYSQAFGSGASFRADGTGGATTGWSRFAQAVTCELAELGRPSVGLSGRIESNLAAGAGLSSSAALEVAIALALCAVAEFDLDAFAIAAACQRAEARAVGVPCGILDPAACLLGSENAAVLLDCSSLEYRSVQIPPDAAFLVLDSGVERALEHTGYAQRRRELERAMEQADVPGLDPVSQRRLRHVRTENARVPAFADAIAGCDLVEAGRLISASHASLRDDYEVSAPELDLLVRLAEQHGAYGARLVGGGFGGAVLALVDADDAVAIGRRIMSGHSGGARHALVVHPSPGAGVFSGAGG